MQNDQSAKRGASGQRAARAGGDVLIESEWSASVQGETLKRVVHSAAALHGIYTDSALAEALKIGRQAVRAWWHGAKPEPDTTFRIAGVTGLSADELSRFLYADGPPPSLPEPGSWLVSSVEEGVRLGRERRQRPDPSTPAPSPPRLFRGTGAGREARPDQ